MRFCCWCGHAELAHYGRGCSQRMVLSNTECRCDGFHGRELEEWELEIMDAEEGQPRGQIGDTEVLDEYSGIREHLGKIMEKASKE